MDLIHDLEWYLCDEPKKAKRVSKNKKITKRELNLIVFNTSETNEPVKISLPLNDQFLFHEVRELPRPVYLGQLLNLIYNYYKEPLKEENVENAFKDMEEWKEEVLEINDGDISKLTNLDVFTDTCTPDFCGIEWDEETNSYYVLIGPE